MTRRCFLCSAGLLAASFVPAATAAAVPDKILPNLDKDGVALQGHDPVAFFTVGAPVKGRPEFESTYRGAKYRFHSARNKAAFDADPAKYEPQFGGWCAYGVSRNALAPIAIEAWQIVNGRLLMQKSTGIRDDFNKDAAGNLLKADEHWPGLVARRGR
ncbi:MAG TPA: YHS domain-containing (seleno)protein [Verrucomicrobiota bacterium]|nr:YHS domain-containing (seleno)protein [Verrucomicrobiota bacterium]